MEAVNNVDCMAEERGFFFRKLCCISCDVRLAPIELLYLEELNFWRFEEGLWKSLIRKKILLRK